MLKNQLNDLAGVYIFNFGWLGKKIDGLLKKKGKYEGEEVGKGGNFQCTYVSWGKNIIFVKGWGKNKLFWQKYTPGIGKSSQNKKNSLGRE